MQLGPVTLWLLLIAIIADAWWASGSHVILDPRMVCKKNRRLRGRLAHICRNETGILREITRGVSIGALECGNQFKHRRWNCTTQRRSMRKILMRDTRETGFVNAITAAGVTYAITRGCTMGTLLECSCEKGPPTRPIKKIISTLGPNDVWQWGGCGDNVRFGLRKSREFMDNQRKKSDIKTLIKRHNYNAGRLALKNYMRLECKCHGLSGSCTVKTCWVKMPTFRDVGNRLFERFNVALKVIASNDGDSFLPENSTKRPRKQDLIYSEESPDFCIPNLQTGSLGTAGRECNASSAGPDGCKTLCCGRRFLEKTVTEMKNCFCEFTWCCKVSCNVCYSKKEFASCL